MATQTVLNLGLVKLLSVGTTPPTNTQLIWLDLTVNLHKYYDTLIGEWTPIVPDISGKADISYVNSQINTVEQNTAASFYPLNSNPAGYITSAPSYTFTNGLTNNSGTVRLGGTLTGPTTITLGVNDITFYDPAAALTLSPSNNSVGINCNNYTPSFHNGAIAVNADGASLIAGTVSSSASITVGNSVSGGSIEITDGINNFGAQYVTDYSSAWSSATPNAIPSVKWVLEQMSSGGSYTFGSGLTDTSGVVTLGGTLTQDVAITSTGYFFQILGHDSSTQLLIDDRTGGGTVSLGNASGALTITSSFSSFAFSDSSLSINGSQMLISDINNIGLVNNGDYEANFVAQSLITKQYADAHYASSESSGVSSFNTRSGSVTLTSTDVTTALTFTPENIADKGAANGYVPLNSSVKIDATYLPSYVSDIITVATFSALPSTGTAGTIYVTADTNYEYRWNAGTSAYIQLVASPGTTDALAEGSTNLYYTNTRVATYGNTLYVQLSGSYVDPSWITSLAFSKLTGTPTNVSYFTNDAGYITSAALAGYEIQSNKVTSLDNSSTHYPSTSAVTAALSNYLTSTSASTTYYPLTGNPSAFLTNTTGDARYQALGNYLTALTGDGTASGPGSAAFTLKTVNANIGTFNNVTVNAKGLVTAASTVTYLTGNQTITITGDITGTGTTAITATLATINSSPGTYGTTSSVPVFVVNGKGLVTSNINTAIQIAESQVTNLVTDLASKQAIISLTTTGSSGAASFVSNTLNIPNYTLAGLGGVTAASFSATTPLTYNSGTQTFAIQQATSTTAGYLSAADWVTFNNATNPIYFDPSIFSGGGTSISDYLTIAVIPRSILPIFYPDSVYFEGGGTSISDLFTVVPAGFRGLITLTTTGSGAATYTTSTGVLNIPTPAAGVTYSAGTGLTLATTTFSVNTSQNITTLSNLTTAGVVTTTSAGLLGSVAILPVANGGTGISTAPANGALLIGNGTGYASATLTGTANEITVTNTAGVITLSTPQAIATSSAPQFAGLGIGVGFSSSTYLLIAGSQTGKSLLRLSTGTAPTTPVSGDIWRTTGSTVQFYDGTTTQTFAYLSSLTGYQTTITLTTTGTSGAATFSGGVLNIPNYAIGGSYTAGTGLTLTGSTFSINTSQNITTLSNLTTAGIVATTSAGLLSSVSLDTTPTSGSSNPITSGAVYTALNSTNVLAVGSGLTITTASGTTTLGVDNTIVPLLAQANSFTALQTVTNATTAQLSLNYDGTHTAVFKTDSTGTLNVTTTNGVNFSNSSGIMMSLDNAGQLTLSAGATPITSIKNVAGDYIVINAQNLNSTGITAFHLGNDIGQDIAELGLTGSASAQGANAMYLYNGGGGGFQIVGSAGSIVTIANGGAVQFNTYTTAGILGNDTSGNITSTAFTAGSVAFGNSGSTGLTQDSTHLYYNATTQSLGIGTDTFTNSSTATVEVSHANGGGFYLTKTGSNAGTFRFTNDGNAHLQAETTGGGLFIISGTTTSFRGTASGTDNILFPSAGGIQIAVGGLQVAALTTAGTVQTSASGILSSIANNGTGTNVLTTSPTLVTPVLGVAAATSINKITITAPTTSATLTLITGSSLITAGAFALTLTSTATTNATLPSGTGTLAYLAGTNTWTGVNKFLDFYATSAVPTQVAGTGAGTTPTMAIVGNNMDGKISITTGTSPTASGIVTTVTMSGSFAYPTGTVCTLEPGNALTAALSGTSQVFVTGTTTTFVITAGTAALAASTAYVWNYHNGGY